MKTPQEIAADAGKGCYLAASDGHLSASEYASIIARHIAPLVEERDKLRTFVDGLDVFESYDTEYAVRNGLVGRRQWARNAQIWLHQGEHLYHGGPRP